MPVLSTNHGLTVLTRADADAPATNGRLQRPVSTDFVLSTTFNDATSGDDYAHSSGHEGIDFDCGEATSVYAMYGGTVTVGTGHAAYGTFIRILSYTNAALTKGFEHTYAHLNSVADENEVVLETGDTVVKGDQIGTSGNTGGVGPHLHVHVKPFAQGGTSVTRDDNPQGCHIAGGPDHTPETLVAPRISGCLNFACFLPASHGGPPVTFDFLRSFNQLLRARDASARIPVDREMWSNGQQLPATALQAASNRLGTLDGSPTGRLRRHRPVPAPDGYQIRWTEPERGWVFQSGTGGAHHGPWVQVEEVPGAVPGTSPS